MLKNNFIILILLFSTACSQFQRRQGGDQQEQPKKQEEIKKAKPKDLAIILGPGGLKSFAHIGVLKDFEDKNLEIKKIVGLEWGAAIGAIYSRKAKGNDLEWQMQKLSKEHLPKEGFFKNNIDLENPNRLNLFFEKVFQDYNLASGKVAFSCPTKTFQQKEPSWLKAGPAYSELKKCIAYPPLFYSYKNWHGDAMAIKKAIKQIRGSGDYYIVLIDVIAEDSFSSSQKILDLDSEKILWQEVRKSLKAAEQEVDFYLPIKTHEFHFLDLAKMRELIKRGQMESEKASEKIKEDLDGRI